MADTDVTLETEGREEPDYSPQSTGWYRNLLPEQRYVAYLTTWLGVAELMSEGRQQEIDAESMVLLAWAPHDTDAYNAADELVSSGRYPGLGELHKKVYGNGMAKDGYENLDFPQINRTDVEQYNVDMIRSVEGNGYVPQMRTGPFYSPGAFEKAAAWLGNVVSSSMDTVREAMGREPENNPEMTGEDIMNRPPATAGDAFYTASQYGAAENDPMMTARIMAGDIGQFAAEGYLLGAGIGVTATMVSKIPSTGVHAAAQSSAASVGQGNSPSQAIVQSINRFKSTGRAQRIWNTSRGVRWGSAGASTMTLATIIGQAALGDVDVSDITGNLSQQSQSQILGAGGYSTPRPPFREGSVAQRSAMPPLETDTAIGRIGAADRERWQGHSVAQAWQQQQAERQREE